jgi:hypothetical protein
MCDASRTPNLSSEMAKNLLEPCLPPFNNVKKSKKDSFLTPAHQFLHLQKRKRKNEKEKVLIHTGSGLLFG